MAEGGDLVQFLRYFEVKKNEGVGRLILEEFMDQLSPGCFSDLDEGNSEEYLFAMRVYCESLLRTDNFEVLESLVMMWDVEYYCKVIQICHGEEFKLTQILYVLTLLIQFIEESEKQILHQFLFKFVLQTKYPSVHVPPIMIILRSLSSNLNSLIREVLELLSQCQEEEAQLIHKISNIQITKDISQQNNLHVTSSQFVLCLTRDLTIIESLLRDCSPAHFPHVYGIAKYLEYTMKYSAVRAQTLKCLAILMLLNEDAAIDNSQVYITSLKDTNSEVIDVSLQSIFDLVCAYGLEIFNKNEHIDLNIEVPSNEHPNLNLFLHLQPFLDPETPLPLLKTITIGYSKWFLRNILPLPKEPLSILNPFPTIPSQLNDMIYLFFIRTPHDIIYSIIDSFIACFIYLNGRYQMAYCFFEVYYKIFDKMSNKKMDYFLDYVVDRLDPDRLPSRTKSNGHHLLYFMILVDIYVDPFEKYLTKLFPLLRVLKLDTQDQLGIKIIRTLISKILKLNISPRRETTLKNLHAQLLNYDKTSSIPISDAHLTKLYSVIDLRRESIIERENKKTKKLMELFLKHSDEELSDSDGSSTSSGSATYPVKAQDILVETELRKRKRRFSNEIKI
eukprot:TRINITY_DN18348_c0_g2_i1.p1 TRINITY_DN18348_c0_g2~~TRINITY_DN18348_c0_g2_i1.p1  ORF type:complete len:645 (+),score=181.92 TRINITY_DN18348_c0_g2_i1:87-1937(+)